MDPHRRRSCFPRHRSSNTGIFHGCPRNRHDCSRSHAGVDIFASPVGVGIAVLAAVAAAAVSVLIYRRISPDQTPVTTGQDTIVGKTGVVTVTVVPDTISGKVDVSGVVWSAKSTGAVLAPGTKIQVTSASGVHLIVEEVR